MMSDSTTTDPHDDRARVRTVAGNYFRTIDPVHFEVFEDSFDLVFSMLSAPSRSTALHAGPAVDSVGDDPGGVAATIFLALRLLQTVSEAVGSDPARALGRRLGELRAANPDATDLLNRLTVLVAENHGLEEDPRLRDLPEASDADSVVPAPLLEIRAHRRDLEISFSLDSPEHHGELVGTTRLETSPDQVILASLRGVAGAAPENRSLLMAGLGEQWARAFLPRRLREILQRYAEGTLMILSNEPWIPWELLRLEHSSAPLGLHFAISRWRPGRRPPLLLTLTPLSLVASHTVSLRHAQSAVTTLRRILGEASVHALEPRLLTVVEALRDAARPAFHFAVHGTSNSVIPDGFGLSLIDDPLTAATVPPLPHHPFAFLNACGAARSAAGLRGPAGIADAWIQRGAGAVIAPLLAVDDRAAAQASLRLYERLLAGDSLAVAVRAVRRDDPDPLGGLSYVAFGSPGASVTESSANVKDRDGAGAAGAPGAPPATRDR